jgi:hypothetical protein
MRIENCSVCTEPIRIDDDPPEAQEGSEVLRLCIECEHDACSFFARYWPTAFRQWLNTKRAK